jgi:hypothetical protein
MMASMPNGVSGPKSTTNPVFLDALRQVTVVPAFTQKGSFDFASGIAGVADAEEAVRLISTVHGVEVDPHVFFAVQIVSGCGSEQRYFSLPRCCSWATISEDSKRHATDAAKYRIANTLRVSIASLPPN